MLSRLVAALLAIGALQEPPPSHSSARASAAPPALTLRQAVGQHMIFAYDGLTRLRPCDAGSPAARRPA